ncbi:MAG: hypothetical protein GWN58_33340 [Anaerolineae bacterium]|nr:hypothetical protein [Thermoplasmata archaeon]NIV34161.1 hypothetical protein [Anaerolineae bacterium]NIY06012.1 hypothetical protein [Thermoplasmata archaeon]
MKLSELMRSAATTDPEEAHEVFSEFQDYVERNRFGLTKLGGPMPKEIRSLLRRVERIAHYLELASAGEPLDTET